VAWPWAWRRPKSRSSCATPGRTPDIATRHFRIMSAKVFRDKNSKYLKIRPAPVGRIPQK
jgi:hypothetical protein